MQDEESIVRRAQQRDEEAFTQLNITYISPSPSKERGIKGVRLIICDKQ